MTAAHIDRLHGSIPSYSGPAPWLAALIAAILAAAPTYAHDHPAYSNDATLFCGAQHLPSKTDWMSRVPGSLKLSELCIPGTHETMSLYWGDAVECQELELIEQLNASIRQFLPSLSKGLDSGQLAN